MLEERDIRYAAIRSDCRDVFSPASPEDYTNRGRIITPLKDRFGAELRTITSPTSPTR